MPRKGKDQINTSSTSQEVTGRVLAHRDGFGFVQAEPDDFYLNKYEMRQVFDGDLVRVKPGKPDNRGRREAVILEVLERQMKRVVGQYISVDDTAFLRPEGMEGGPDITIPRKMSGDARHGQMVVAEIKEYPTAYRPAYAKVVEILGDKMDAGVEIQVAIRRFDIPHEWPRGVENDAERIGSSVKAKDKKNRVDLREQPFVTIDGEDARDFDDAVLCYPTDQGFKLWVAIADVSHYVMPGSKLDKEAVNRGNSVYFPDHVVPMLPEALSNGLCSLNPKVDRLTLACEMDISRSGEILDYKFCEALIRSHARLTYTRVFQALEEKGKDETPTRDELGDLAPQLDSLDQLFHVLFERRTQRGAMEFETVETKIVFDRNRKIKEIVPVHRNRAHRLIEECMLCANVCAADLLENADLDALFRVHEAPVADKLGALRDYLSQMGLWLGGGDTPQPADFKQLSEVVAKRPDALVVQMQILRSLQQAVYQPENKGHFGLAYPRYTHFTSPIRRYPDLLVHRAIRYLIRSNSKNKYLRRVDGAGTLRKNQIYPYDLDALKQLGENCSMTERRADDATRDVIQWLKCEYLMEHVGEKHHGIVSAVTHFGLFVQLEQLFIEGLVHITALPSDYYEFDAATMQLIGRSSRRIFSLGDRALVQIARVSLDERKIDLVLADSSESQGGRKDPLPPPSNRRKASRGDKPGGEKKRGGKRTTPKHKRRRR